MKILFIYTHRVKIKFLGKKETKIQQYTKTRKREARKRDSRLQALVYEQNHFSTF